MKRGNIPRATGVSSHVLSAALRARIVLASLVTRAVVSRLAGFWLALLVLGAVIFGPNGLSAIDVTRGLRAEPWIAVALALLWSAAHTRAARVLSANELDFVRAIPLGSVDRFVTTALPRVAPHAIIGAFFARSEGLIVGAITTVVAAIGTTTMSVALERIESTPSSTQRSSRSLASAHARFAWRQAHSTLVRVGLFSTCTCALSAIAIANNRAPPTGDTGLATVLLLLASGAWSAAMTGVVRESERAMEFLLATQPNALADARRARRTVAWGVPAGVGALSAAMASAMLGLGPLLASALVYGLHWLTIAVATEQLARRGFDESRAATGLTFAGVLFAMVASLDARIGASCLVLAAGIFSSVRT